MRKVKIKFILTTLALIFLGLITLGIRSCYLDRQVTSGIIVDKYHNEEYTYITYMYVGDIMVPQMNYVPEDYGVIIVGKDCNGQDRSIYLSSYNMYLHTNVGDNWHK